MMLPIPGEIGQSKTRKRTTFSNSEQGQTPKKKLGNYGELYQRVFGLRKANNMAEVLFHLWNGQTGLKEPPTEYLEMVLDWERYIDRDRYTHEFLATNSWIFDIVDAHTSERPDARASQRSQEERHEAHLVRPFGDLCAVVRRFDSRLEPERKAAGSWSNAH